MLHRKWCCICNILFCLRIQWAQRPYHHIFFLRAIPLAVLSTHCKIDFFCEVMFQHRHLVALSWCPHFFRWPFPALELDQQSDKLLYIVSPLLNESSLDESIVTQLIPALEWLCQLHRSSHEFASTSSLPVCGCYDECKVHMRSIQVS